MAFLQIQNITRNSASRSVRTVSLMLAIVSGSVGQLALTVSTSALAQSLPTPNAPAQELPDTLGEPDGIDPDSNVTVIQPRFDCQFSSGQYTVTYHPDSRPNEAFPWAVPQAMGGGWTPEDRCLEISRRLEEYRPDGLLELQTSVENGYDIVCVTTEDNPQCRIVFTVPPGQDPVVTRDAVFENLTIADSGEMTQGVNTFVGTGQTTMGNLINLGWSLLNGQNPTLNSAYSTNPLGRGSSSGINLKPYLDVADRGTGTALSRRRSIPR